MSEVDEGLKQFLKRVADHPVLTAAQEQALARRYLQQGDEGARQELLLHNMRLVISIARNYRDRGLPFADLIQEGVIGLDKATQKFDPERGFKFSCVPLSTQILTRRGWCSYDGIQDGDETLGYVAGRTEWTPIQDVVKYEDAPLVRVGNKHWGALATPQHRWLVARGGQVELEELDAAWWDTREPRTDQHLVLSAPFIGGQSPLTPDEAAVLAWVLSDGHVHWSRPATQTSPSACIVQSERKHTDEIRALLQRADAYVSERRHGERDCLAFYVSAPYFQRVWDLSGLHKPHCESCVCFGEPTETPLIDLVLALSAEARSAWFDAWRKAEGLVGRGLRTIYQNAGESLDALELCAFLEGHQTRTSVRKNSSIGSVRLLTRPPTPRRTNVTVEGSGAVWCPRTGLGTWTARSADGYVFLTGNTYATWWIRQSIRRGLSGSVATIRLPPQVAERRLKLQLALLADPERDLEEVAAALEIELAHGRSALDAAEVVTSLDREWVDEHTLLETLSDPHDVRPGEVLPEHPDGMIAEALRELPELHRQVLALRFGLLGGEPRSLAEVAEVLGRSTTTVQGAQRDALSALRTALDSPEGSAV